MFVKKWGSFLAACVIYAVTVVLLWYVQECLYPDVFKLPMLLITLFPPVVLVIFLMMGGYPKEQPVMHMSLIRRLKSKEVPLRDKLISVFNVAVVAACSIFLFWALLMDPYSLRIYMYFVCLFILLFLSRFWDRCQTAHKLSRLTCWMYFGLLAVTLCYLLLIRPISIHKAYDILETEGYTGMELKQLVRSNETLGLLFEDEFIPEPDKDKLGYYLLRCERENKAYGCALRILDGRLAAVKSLEDGGSLETYMEFY